MKKKETSYEAHFLDKIFWFLIFFFFNWKVSPVRIFLLKWITIILRFHTCSWICFINLMTTSSYFYLVASWQLCLSKPWILKVYITKLKDSFILRQHDMPICCRTLFHRFCNQMQLEDAFNVRNVLRGDK